jgi:3-oxoacyl-[acyl-carrier protein] reductase
LRIDLSQKTAFVCGSTQGIGRAIAHVFAECGANVVLIARNPDKLMEVSQSLPKSEGQYHDIICADFDQPAQLQAQLKVWMQTHTTPVHILVNNSGGPPAELAIDSAPEAYEIAFRRHLICNQILTQSVVGRMKNAGYGRIINIISTSVKQPLPGLGVSNTVRGAVASWAKTLANELGPYGITVNNVLPGATKTERLNDILHKWAEKNKITYEEMVQKSQSSIPARRFAEPEELAYAVAFLATPFAAYINGINLPVDGGRTQCL